MDRSPRTRFAITLNALSLTLNCPSFSTWQKILQQVEYLLSIALQDDERKRIADASKMYTCAIELAIQAVSVCGMFTHLRSVLGCLLVASIGR